MELSINSDDTIDGSIIMAFSDEVAEMLGTDPEALWADAGSDFESDFPEGATQEPYAQDGYTGTKVTFVDIPLEEMSGTGDVDSLSITREGDEYVVSGAMDLSDTGDMEGAESLMSGFDVRIAITFPGAVTEHNGTLEGRTVTWEPAVGERTEISARGAASAGVLGGAASSWLPIVVGVLVLAAVSAVIAVVVTSRGKRSAAAASGAGAPAYPPAYPPVPHPQTGYPQPPTALPYPQPPTALPYPQQPPTPSASPPPPPPTGGPQDPPPPV